MNVSFTKYNPETMPFVTSQIIFNNFKEYETKFVDYDIEYRAPRKQRNAGISSVYLEKKLKDIINLIKYFTYELSIDIATAGVCSYECSVMDEIDLIEFKINIYEHSYENNKIIHIVEFNLLEGDRYSFGEVLANIGSLINVIIPGALRLPKFEPDPEFSQDLDIILDFLKDDSSINQIYGMEILAQFARDLSTVSSVSLNFNKWAELVEEIFNIIEHYEYERTLMKAVYTLGVIFSLDIPWDNEILQMAVSTAKFAFPYGYHIRRECLRILCNLSTKITIPKEDIIKMIGRNKFHNDKSAYNYSQKLLA
jgi:hypothetical protein